MTQRLPILMLIFIFAASIVLGQEDTTFVEDDFDFSDFELAAEPAKSFCNNKVLGQSPTTLVGLFYDFMPEHDLVAGTPVSLESNAIDDASTIDQNQRIALTTNLPIISRNNILVNFNAVYQRQFYNISGSDGHPLLETLNDNGLTRLGALFTVFKPLNDKKFFLGQVGFEINGDYALNDINTDEAFRFPAALLYGWKPTDRLMYAFGLSRTYLGGALNYVPIVYYYHTFKNQKWGIESVLPSRGYLRYRFDSQSLIRAGFTVIGATYALNNWNTNAFEYAPGVNELWQAEAVELRRSEIRAGLNYQRQLFGFFWLSAEAGYRINYSFELDQDGDFVRLFGNDEPYFIENELDNQMYFTVGITYTSP
ncbi:MAG: hypothetical protein AAGC47_03840 [Bacteroidota bacterium]